MVTKVKVVSEDKVKLAVEISNISTIQANTIRRAIISFVPTMAIEEVEFKKNSSVLYDEVVAHRLGLCSLKSDLESYILPDKEEIETREYGARSSVKLTLKAKGPKTVYAGDLKSKDPKIVPVHPKTPIVKLAEGQELEFVATAVLGIGKNHAKWTPGLVWYTNTPIIKVNSKSSKLAECKDKLPPQIFDKNGKIDEKLINSPQLVDACEGVCDDVIKISYEDNSFIFYIESWGQLSPKDILKQSINSFDSKLNEFQKQIKDI